MRKRKSKLLQTLLTIEDLLLLCDDYFAKDKRKCPTMEDWLYAGVTTTTSYFIDKGVLNPDLSFREKPKSILKLIKKPWDKKWRFVVFDIPSQHNKYRDRIRNRLKEWDFKFYQRSVWFSPLELRKQIKQLDKQIGDTDYLSVIEGKIYKINPRKLIEEKWQVSNWSLQINYWIDDVVNSGELNENREENFWELIKEHPKVPLDLLPNSWPLYKAFKTFYKYKF